MENKKDDLLMKDRQDENHVQRTQTNDEQNQKQRKDPSKKTNKLNWRSPIYRSTMETRASTHKVTGSLNMQDGKLELVEQLSTTGTVIAKGSELVMGNNSDRFLQRLLRSNVEDSVVREMNSMGPLENNQTQVIKPNRATCNPFYNVNIFEDLQNEHLDGIRVLTDNTVAMFNINRGRTALPLVNLVNSILLLAEQQGWKVEAQHTLAIMN
ncbi:MAG: hypothetical protein EZS28_028652 [Streblomastix strix]|uniref:Uncharacterized protein n=1 Tax=Streblomastix strix TaxID=222440 RepID=A0A5J4UZ92_9EUKA|nr:MAG: hypothetical protein EZS28_028652 [Streblomastix strix]